MVLDYYRLEYWFLIQKLKLCLLLLFKITLLKHLGRVRQRFDAHLTHRIYASVMFVARPREHAIIYFQRRIHRVLTLAAVFPGGLAECMHQYRLAPRVVEWSRERLGEIKLQMDLPPDTQAKSRHRFTNQLCSHRRAHKLYLDSEPQRINDV